jgi:enterochelin esterase-like enzyme
MARLDALPPMGEVADGVWAVTLDLPERSRVEYKVAVTVEGHEDLRPDPLNPSTAPDPFGFNSVVSGPGYAIPEWVDPDAPHGSLAVSTVRSPGFHAMRRVTAHLPHRYPADAPYPLLVVHDGSDFIRFANLVESLEGLAARRLIRPVVAVMTDPGDRLGEYGDDARHAEHVDAVLRHAVRRYRIDHDPASWFLLGASLGGVAALSAARRLDVPLGGLVLLSGSFVPKRDESRGRGSQFDGVIGFTQSVLGDPGTLPPRIAMACGAYENLSVDNRLMAERLATRSDVVYEEAPDGHHWHNWRDRLGNALSHVLP